MREFFRGWKRKVGLVMLLISMALLAGWMRSSVYKSEWSFHQDDHKYQSLSSYKGYVTWLKLIPLDASRSTANSMWSDESRNSLKEGLDKQIAAKIEQRLQRSIGRTPQVVANTIVAGATQNENAPKWKFSCCGVEIGESHFDRNSPFPMQISIWRGSYWMLTLLPTVISLCLLLSSPEIPLKGKTAKPNQGKELGASCGTHASFSVDGTESLR